MLDPWGNEETLTICWLANSTYWVTGSMDNKAAGQQIKSGRALSSPQSTVRSMYFSTSPHRRAVRLGMSKLQPGKRHIHIQACRFSLSMEASSRTKAVDADLANLEKEDQSGAHALHNREQTPSTGHRLCCPIVGRNICSDSLAQPATR